MCSLRQRSLIPSDKSHFELPGFGSAGDGGWGAGSGAGEGSVILCLLGALGQLWMGSPSLPWESAFLPSTSPTLKDLEGDREGGGMRMPPAGPSHPPPSLRLPSAGVELTLY